MFSINVKSLADLNSTAKKMLETFSNQRVFALHGKMGAGKTTFVQELCKVLGSEDYVTSPTFALVNEYSDRNLSPIFHFDFYRIKKIEEAFDMGFEEYIYSDNYCFIEWPEKIESLLPGNYLKIIIDIVSKEKRKITMTIINN